MGLNVISNKRSNDLKPGTRIELIQMDDPYATLQPGDRGVVDFIDDADVIHMKWDNGSTLGLLADVDEYKIIRENVNRYRPFPKERNEEIGKRNEKLYQQGEERMMAEEGFDGDDNNPDGEGEEEVDPYEGKERRFRVSMYVDIHVPMTANIEHDRQAAEQEASNILKKFKFDSVSNTYLGGIAHNPFGTMPDEKEFERL